MTAFFHRPATALAPLLIGARLSVRGAGGIITETEAYTPEDPASHSFPGPTRRNAAMFGPAGRAYVYRIYGLHWCLNLVAAPGHAVLIRALEPDHGLDRMAERRGTEDPRLLATGPGRLAQALGVTGADDHRAFVTTDFALEPGVRAEILTGPRIGITKAADWPRRYGMAGSRFLSRPFPG